MYTGDVISCVGVVLVGIGLVMEIFFLTTRNRRKQRIEQLMRERY